MLSLQDSIRKLKGVGEKRTKILEEEGIFSLRDLLYYFPFRYEKTGVPSPLAQLKEGKGEAIGCIERRRNYRRGARSTFEIVLRDSTGCIKAVWFNQPFLKRILFPGKRLYLKGRIYRYGGELVFSNPDFKILKEGEKIEPKIKPVYERIRSLSSGILENLIVEALQRCLIEENLPRQILEKFSFPSRSHALHYLHQPPPEADIDLLNSRETLPHRRIKFEEAFIFETSLLYLRKIHSQVKKPHRYTMGPELEEMMENFFPFSLTRSQRKALESIKGDLLSEYPMRRLLQGEVGSGKTAVAILSSLIPIGNGYQVAFMVPTEILAEQHHRRLSPLFQRFGIEIALLTGSIRGGRRQREREKILSGRAKLIIGTHALFYEDVSFPQLSYAIVDEQQRFGVSQRAKLYSKGETVDFLLMTATPIPRTLALTLFSDLNLSVIEELPAGSREVETKVLRLAEFRKILPFIKQLLSEGSQGIAVFPTIQRSEKLQVVDLERGFNRLKELLPEFRLAMVHGRMASEEKAEVVEKFERGDIDLLVSTTVVEVGLDIENASFILIFNAERYGLAQLHQLRGRVGRSGQKAYCFLLLGKQAGEAAYERVKFLEKCSDGFEIARKDLELRGPGSAVGRQQWGIPSFSLLDPLQDTSLLEAAKLEAERILISNPEAVSNIIEDVEKQQITFG